MRTLYCAVDLHSSNGYYGIVEKSGERVFGRRLPNDLTKVLEFLVPLRDRIKSIAVESTYNWYWLVDGLNQNGFTGRIKLANPAAMDSYSGMKNTNDKTDAFFIAELLRLDILPTGYIYPQEERFVRDILRRRSLFVRQRTAHILSLQSMLSRQSGKNLSVLDLFKSDPEKLFKLLGSDDNVFMAKQNIAMIRFLCERIKLLEDFVLKKVELKPEFEKLLTVPGIGKILGLTIMCETGDISRFAKAGNYTSYCRCVKAEAISNNKKKGNNNRKNGNKYLSWAFIEAAHHMKSCCSKAQSYYDRKYSKSGKGALATKSLAAKMSKAVFYVLKNQEDFNEKKIFG